MKYNIRNKLTMTIYYVLSFHDRFKTDKSRLRQYFFKINKYVVSLYFV